jgi:hypothetical protein
MPYLTADELAFARPAGPALATVGKPYTTGQKRCQQDFIRLNRQLPAFILDGDHVLHDSVLFTNQESSHPRFQLFPAITQ